MAIYIVLHHQQSRRQPWKNTWLTPQLIETIETTNEIGRYCQEAKEMAQRVFVHRCGWHGGRATICCSAEVKEVVANDDRTMLVRFGNAVPLDDIPPVAPVRHQNFYNI